MNYALAVLIIGAAAATPALAQQRTVKMPYLACKSETTFARGEEIRRSGDFAALKQFLLVVIPSGACTWFEAGATVYYEGIGSSAAIAKVRPPGEITSFYSRVEILD